MEYIVEKNDKTYYYEVGYDKTTLKSLFNDLKKLTYKTEEKISGGGRRSSIFDTPNKLKEQSRHIGINIFERYAKYIGNYEVLYDKEKFTSERVGFEIYYHRELVFLYTRYTNLYFVLEELFENKPNIEIIKKIIEYSESKEFKELESNKDFDYKKLLEVYSNILRCFKFKLIAVKENVESNEIEDGNSIKRK